MKYIALLIVIFTLGCKGHKNSLSNTNITEASSEELELLLSDNYGGAALQEIRVIRTSAELKTFFLEINKTRKPGLPIPKINFSKKMVVIYCSGATTNSVIPGLYMVSESDDRLILGIKKQNQSQETSSTAMILPFGLYTMSLTDKEVVLDNKK